MDDFSPLYNLLNLFSASGAYSPGLAVILLAFILLATCKLPGFSEAPEVGRAGKALGMHFLLSGLSFWIPSWDFTTKGILGFLAMLQLWALGITIYYFVIPLTSFRRIA